jgi:hypothetical protein
MEKLSVKELKALIKAHHAKSLPKMSAGKDALLVYAASAGLLKKKDEDPTPPAKTKAPKELPAELKKPAGKVKVSQELPEVLKAPAKTPAKTSAKKLKEPEAPPAPAKKSPTAFAAFMAANKGQGHSMADLSAMYRAQKESSE